MDRIDTLVIGAGVVGLAIARALAQAGREVVVLEASNAIGTGSSSRNSEVIHSGLYYTPGSLKARLCVAGKQMLYAYCAERGIPHRRCGKLVVATTPEQILRLSAIKATAEENGVDDLAFLEPAAVFALEPELACCGALVSPSSGIFDSYAYMFALQADVEAAGGIVALNSSVIGGTVTPSGIEVRVAGTEQFRLQADLVVNSAGLGAQGLARDLEGFPADLVPPLHLAKGSYFSLSGRPPFGRLVYPLPSDGGLGVHATLDMAGRVRFGPDVEWIDEIDFTIDAKRADVFYAAVRDYWPALPDGALVPDYTGIRPKVERPGGSATDFVIQGQAQHGVSGLINLFGIESPGLTSSLAIADTVAAIAAQRH